MARLPWPGLAPTSPARAASAGRRVLPLLQRGEHELVARVVAGRQPRVDARHREAVEGLREGL